MLGAWSTFGSHPPPQDGEVIVVVMVGNPSQQLFGTSGEALLAIYRSGALLTQDGRTMPVPFGAEWVTLPNPSVKA